MHDRPCYEVEFSDGSVIVADAEHQWLTETRAARKSKWAADRQYNRARNQQTLPVGRHHRGDRRAPCTVGADGRANHAVVNADAAARARGRPALIPPYALGAWLGDGHCAGTRITCETDEIPMYIEGLRPRRASQHGGMLYSDQAARAMRHRRTTWRGTACPDCGERLHSGSAALSRPATPTTAPSRRLLRKLGVLGDKHIPAATSGPPSRCAASCWPACSTPTARCVKGVGSCQFAVTNQRLGR